MPDEFAPARNVKNDPKGRFLDSSLEESGFEPLGRFVIRAKRVGSWVLGWVYYWGSFGYGSRADSEPDALEAPIGRIQARWGEA